MVEAATQKAVDGLFPKKTQKNDPGYKQEPKNGFSVDVAEYLHKYNVEVVKTKPHGSSSLYCLKSCIFDSGHTGNEAAIGQTADGKLFYQCFHDSCKGRTWQDARKIISGDDPMYGQAANTGGGLDLDGIEPVSYGDIAEMEFDDTPLIDGLLDRKDTLIISGPSGIGKSAFANFLTLAAANPSPNGLWGKFKIPRELTTLVIQSENSMKAQSKRINMLFTDVPEFRAGSCRVITTKINNDCRLFGDLVDPEFKAKILYLLEETKADILLLDPLISYHSADENDNVGMRHALDHMTSICDTADIASIIFHHFNRNGQTRGASSIRDWAANLLLMEHADEQRRNMIKMTHDKCRNFEQQAPFYLDRTPNLSFLLCDPPGGRGAASAAIVVEAIQSCGGCVDTQNELTKEVMAIGNCVRSTAQRIIKDAVLSGKVLEIKNGKSACYLIP